MSTLRQEVIRIITEICDPEEPDLSDENRPLLESGMDSLDFATMLMALEDRFGVTVEEADLKGLRTLRNVVDFLERHARV